LDRPRFIGPIGYVSSPFIAVDPLEAVRSEEQERQSRDAHIHWTRERRRRWGAASTSINTVLDEFAQGGVDRRLESDLRAIRRGADRVGRRLDDELRRVEGATTPGD
jgi:hypothetical protein